MLIHNVFAVDLKLESSAESFHFWCEGAFTFAKIEPLLFCTNKQPSPATK